MDNVDERRRLCAALLERTGLKIDPDDPAFVLVELNRLVLQEESVKAVNTAGEQANARLLASADAWAAQSNQVLGLFAARTEELRGTLESAVSAARPPSPASPVPAAAAVKAGGSGRRCAPNSADAACRRTSVRRRLHRGPALWSCF